MPILGKIHNSQTHRGGFIGDDRVLTPPVQQLLPGKNANAMYRI